MRTLPVRLAEEISMNQNVEINSVLLECVAEDIFLSSERRIVLNSTTLSHMEPSPNKSFRFSHAIYTQWKRNYRLGQLFTIEPLIFDSPFLRTFGKIWPKLLADEKTPFA